MQKLKLKDYLQTMSHPSKIFNIEVIIDDMVFVGKDINGKISILFGIYGIPESILVDSDLTVIKKIVGPIDKVQYNEILELVQ